MKFIFQGESHYEDAESFRLSSADERAWRIQHPEYDDLLVQPLSLGFDNTAFNVTEINCSIMETIDEAFPQSQQTAIEEIEESKEALDEQAVNSYEENAEQIDGAEGNEIKDDMNNIESDTEKITVGEQAAGLKNTINTALNAVNSAVIGAETFMTQAQAAINYPFQVSAIVSARVSSFKSSFDRLTGSISTLLGNNKKKYYEAYGTSNISGACLATVNQIEDFPFESRTEVEAIIETITTMFDDYVTKLDEIQSASTTEDDPYIPDPETFLQLQQIVNLTLSSLLTIAFGSKIEQSIILEEDSDPINVTHRLIGVTDEDLEKMISINELTLDEHFLIKKGRKIIYYV